MPGEAGQYAESRTFACTDRVGPRRRRALALRHVLRLARPKNTRSGHVCVGWTLQVRGRTTSLNNPTPVPLTLFRFATGAVGATGLYSPPLWLNRVDDAAAQGRNSRRCVGRPSATCCVVSTHQCVPCSSPRDSAKITLPRRLQCQPRSKPSGTDDQPPGSGCASQSRLSCIIRSVA